MRKRLAGDTITRLTPAVRAMFLVALAVALHQILMATPVHARVMPMLAASAMPMHHAADAAPMRGMCPHCPISTATLCPAVQAVFPTIAAALALVAIFLTFLMAAATAPGFRHFVQAVWYPPPKHTLVLFQVRLC